MSQMALHTLVGTALTDRNFCADLLNGRRHILLAGLDLTDEEREAVLGVEAGSIQEFAAQLCDWLKARGCVVSPSPTAISVSRPFLWSPVGSAFWQGDNNSRNE